MRRRLDSEEAEEASGAAADLEVAADSGAADLVVEGSGAGGLVAASGAAYPLADSGEQASVAVVHWLWPVSAAGRAWGVPGGVARVVRRWRLPRGGVCSRGGDARGAADRGET